MQKSSKRQKRMICHFFIARKKWVLTKNRSKRVERKEKEGEEKEESQMYKSN